MTSSAATEASHLRNAWTTVSPLGPHFLGEGAKMSNRLQNSKWSPWITVSKTVNFFTIGWNIIDKSNREPNLTQNEHVYAIFCWLEVAGDVISGDAVKTIEGYAVLHFEAASISFRENQNQPFA